MHSRLSQTRLSTKSTPAPQAQDDMWHEPALTTFVRRLISVPGLFLITGIYLALLPVFLAYSVVADLLRRRPMLLARFHVAMVSVLLWHIVGVLALFLWWIAGCRWLGYQPRNWRAWNRRLEGWWGSWVIGIAAKIYNMSMEIEGDEHLAPGPILIFARHTSIIDTMLPLRILEHYHGMIARIVKKRELLWDPCVDGVSHRLPRTFVRRGSNNHERELELVRTLTNGMGEYDALWIYPEGTRFTPQKRARVLERLHERHPEAAQRAERLRNTLPPRPGGALALLDQCNGMDVVFCAHTGMEGANRLENVINGSLLGKTVKVRFWRVPAADIPANREERLLWLHSWWERIDRWVESNQDRD